MTKTAIHPKVTAHLVIGVALTVATIIAHVAAGANEVPWLATYGALAVTVLGFVGGYVTPSPLPKSVGPYVGSAAAAATIAANLLTQLKALVDKDGTASSDAPDVSRAFPKDD